MEVGKPLQQLPGYMLELSIPFSWRGSTHVGSNKTKRGVSAVPRMDRGQENTRSGAVEGNERCRDLGRGRSGTCRVEIRDQHNEVEVEEGVSCVVRKDLEWCTMRRKDSGVGYPAEKRDWC